MKFIVDTQLPPNLAKFFSYRGYDAIHTSDLPNGHLMKDSEIILVAKNKDRVIATKDNDFLDNYLINGAPPKILFIQLGNISNKNLIDKVSESLNEIIEGFKKGSSFIALRNDSIVVYK